MATDSASRSTSWNNKVKEHMGKKLEEFITRNNLQVFKEGNGITDFQGSRGISNMDLTKTNNQMLAVVKNWDIPEEESASDHNIIKFSISLDKHNTQENHYAEERYRTKEHLQI